MHYSGPWRPGCAGSPLGLRPWLTHPASMTRALTQALGAAPRVQLLYSGPGSLLPHEQAALGVAGQRQGYLREIALRCADHWCLRARSVTPLANHSQVQRLLRGLGPAPLGELLFFALGPHSPVRLGMDFSTCPWQGLWGRRSLWKLHQTPLLVSEFFLTSLADEAPPPNRYTARRLLPSEKLR